MKIGIRKHKGGFIFIPFFLISVFLSFNSCGVKGPPLQPVPGIIPPVEKVKIYQKGGFLFVSISLPESYPDNTSLKIKKVKVYYSFYPIGKIVDLKKFLKEAKSEELSPEEKNIVLKKEIKDFDKSFKILIYCWDLRNKRSQPSKLFEFEVKKPPPRPENLRAEVREDGIYLKWEMGEETRDKGFFVYLFNGEEFEKLNTEPIVKKEFIFKDFAWEKEYKFRVSTVLKNIYESEDSEEISVIPVDKFPPPPPENLVAIPEEGFILLKWDGVDVPDLEKYNVYRMENGKRELLTLKGTKETFFEDREGEKGKIYKYFVTAVDKRGNESIPSNFVEERFR